MGLFSSKKTTFVSSVAYNMAGEEDGRTNYLSSLIVQNIVSRTSASMADSIRAGMIHGPTMNLRAYYRWAKNHYTTVGMPTASINGYSNIDTSVIEAELPVLAGKTAYVITVDESPFDYELWAEKYVVDHHPELWDTEWSASIDEANIITITYADNTVESFLMTDFDKSASYLYILYAYSTSGELQPVVTGTTNSLGSADAWPSVSGWTKITDTEPTVNQSLNKITTTTKSYSDGRPNEVTSTTTTSTQSFVDRDAHYRKNDASFQDPDANYTRLISRQHDIYFITNYSVTHTINSSSSTAEVDGVIVTTTIDVDQEVLNISRTYREDYQDEILLSYTDLGLWLYKIGSNLNLNIEAMIGNPVPVEGDFFPCVPVRYENKFISEDYRPTLYAQTKKAYKKSTGKKVTSLIDDLKDNDNLGDIDFAFVHFGVSLNVQDKQCRKYLFRFFERLMGYQNYDENTYNEFITALANYNNAIDTWAPIVHPGESTPEYPPLPALPVARQTIIQIKSQGTEETNFDIRLAWNFITHGSGSGLGKVGAKKGDLWFEILPTSVWSQYVIGTPKFGGKDASRLQLVKGDDYEMENVRLYWQTDVDAYEYVDIHGMSHYNVVYNGKQVKITTNEALQDDDESGFVVPLHYQTMKELGLMSSNQMSTACIWMIFNCYKIVKQKWYEKGIFKIFLVIAVAIVSAAFTGGAGIGILGANLTVGSSLGFTGLTAAIVGSVANALAAVIVTSLISTVSTSIFGERFGALIGAVLSFVVINVAVSFQTTGMASFNWGDMMKAENLLKLTDAVSQGYSAYMAGVNQDILAKTQKLQSDYEKESQEITDKYNELIGYTNLAVNSSWFTDSTNYLQYEPSSSFLRRTLMTGTDVAQMSMDMVTDYVDLNLTLPSVYG